MRIAMTLLALSLAVAPTGCKKKNKDTTTETGSGSAMVGSSMAGSDMGSAMAGSAAGSAMAGSDMGSGGSAMAGSAMGAGSGSDATMAHHAGNCPATVLGATTTAEVKGKDVVVTIKATDKDAVKAIQTRTDALVKQIAKPGHEPGTTHDQKGTHGGTMGLCPIHVPDGGTAKAKHEKDGVVVTITPKDNVDALKTDIDGRIQKAADWVKANIQPGDKGNMGGVGGGKADEGMNRSGKGDGKGMDRKKGDGKGGGEGTGGGGGKGTGGGGKGSAKK